MGVHALASLPLPVGLCSALGILSLTQLQSIHRPREMGVSQSRVAEMSLKRLLSYLGLHSSLQCQHGHPILLTSSA